MSLDVMPEWLINLNSEELNFIKRFVLSSGSLKEMASQYGGNVSYGSSTPGQFDPQNFRQRGDGKGSIHQFYKKTGY